MKGNTQIVSCMSIVSSDHIVNQNKQKTKILHELLSEKKKTKINYKKTKIITNQSIIIRLAMLTHMSAGWPSNHEDVQMCWKRWGRKA